ncbi:hypothetical protein HO173_003792 [Letharia columbiana]|uniref:Uncharacterized protein n=1 Tax=Letharia columbiana TaxID=112416 RepID=A0A8H6G0D2_9LECA|nr:uncharacterized protein HO173_003792 [Letharia columbiana]KAF6238158.1 hypothetical protein HO173_003792 [Letharia columbiana]
MPSPPSPPHDSVYAQLIAALHPSPPVVLEVEILPSSFPPQLLHESAAVGVPKSLLVPLYLTARKTFFDHVSSRDSDSYPAALQATAVILLFDPNHLTAANFRKRHIQRFSGERSENDYNDRDLGNLADAVRHELNFLEILVTSPLSKHAKSSTLWAQRLWTGQNFFPLDLQEHAADEAIQVMITGNGIKSFWDEELVIVMKAGERHPSNYYAWQYARQLFTSIRFEHPGFKDRRHGVRVLLYDSIGLVHGWCLMHPRDISGWAFLVFLLEQLRDEGCDEGDKTKVSEDEILISASETKEFAKKYEWKGESIEWFLKAMKTLDIDD